MGIGRGQVPLDGLLELTGAPVHSPPELLFGQRRKLPLDQVEPGGAGRGEVQVIPRAFGSGGDRTDAPMGGSWGVVSRVRVRTRSTSASVMRRRAPGRGSSSRPSKHLARKRARHFPTGRLLTWRSAAT